MTDIQIMICCQISSHSSGACSFCDEENQYASCSNPVKSAEMFISEAFIGLY